MKALGYDVMPRAFAVGSFSATTSAIVQRMPNGGIDRSVAELADVLG